MKILFGMPSKESLGGPIATEPPLAEACRALGHEIVQETFVYGDQETPTPTLRRVVRVLKSAFRLRRRLSAGDFDVVHLNTAFDRRTILRDSITLFLMRPGKAKVFLKIHGSSADALLDERGLMRRLINYMIKRVDGLGVHTNEECDDLEKIGFSREKMWFIKNAIVIGDLIPAGFERRQKDPGERFELVFVSRFVETKGLIETLQACAELRRRNVDFRLTAIGGGEIAKEAVAETVRLGIDDIVRFTGYIPETEVAQYLLDSDLLVFPTRHREGFPTVLFNSVTVGLPIVTTRIRAARDYLNDRENCLFCLPEPIDIADKIQELIADKELREAISAANFKFGNTLKPEKIALEFCTVYENMLRS
jgi:glycosyltransferase involved in cell wall biosynthesis